MKRRYFWGCLIVAASLFISCTEKGTSMGPYANETPEMTAQRQIPGCQNGSRGIMPNDKCFEYTFSNDTLQLEFCVAGNCCPDSNRFVLESEFNGANLFVTVTDTADNLCRCMCNYKVQAEFSQVTGSLYTVICTYGDSILYRERIVRPE